MAETMNTENSISYEKNALIVLSSLSEQTETDYLKKHFCGQIFTDLTHDVQSFEKVFICGDFSQITHIDASFHIIQELSINHQHLNNPLVILGQVPIVIHQAGVYFRQLFTEKNLFSSIESEHLFQDLTESNKPSKAFRKGIYLTKVTKIQTNDVDSFSFRLLRCSSNLSGATDNLRDTDKHIITTINAVASSVFEKSTDLNHVLAQIYYNQKSDGNKEIKAKIKAHSDKTKDMPKQGLIAFCSFYDEQALNNLQTAKVLKNNDRFDWCYKDKSGLTRLLFKLKKGVSPEQIKTEHLVDSFSITLYPNSVFIIPLSTNRFYTHEIRPSMLNIHKTPTRMGYVVRCSNLEALYQNKQTFIKENEEWVPLVPMTDTLKQSLKNNYHQENRETAHVDYGNVHD